MPACGHQQHLEEKEQRVRVSPWGVVGSGGGGAVSEEAAQPAPNEGRRALGRRHRPWHPPRHLLRPSVCLPPTSVTTCRGSGPAWRTKYLRLYPSLSREGLALHLGLLAVPFCPGNLAWLPGALACLPARSPHSAWLPLCE